MDFKKSNKVFELKTYESPEQTKVMLANQGLYNLFLATDLLWSLLLTKTDTIVFF